MRLRGVIRLAAAAALTAALTAALAAGCSEDTPGQPADPPSPYGKTFPAASTQHISINKGERFSLVVDENASVGDMWEVKTPPDTKIATVQSEDYVSDSPTGTIGGGGKRYFVLTANEPGDSSIELYNCFRGCKSEQDKAQSKRYTVHLTVTSP